ncbi:type II toxin-antitoxin system HicA family toxin [Nocardia sp. BMG111209]|uniref:type II toxin-antitoxin system HicA family toxin n=1 Tax=Nocardia sp. BMG111209 TaxID=1160137 RepID=UPI00038266C8|nr:type II toxin-antitoxin system HicA family toxin [Nocardia sp. BMG111209]
MDARGVNRRIEQLGGVSVRQVGSHRRYRIVYELDTGQSATAHTTVPQHSGDMPIGTLRAIERDLAPAFGSGWLRGERP